MLQRLWDWIYQHDLEIIVVPAIILVLLATMCIVPLTINNYFVCRDNSTNLELETRWSFWAGCYYNLDGVWYTGDIAEDILRQQYQVDLGDLDFSD
jgi:hypothetical protein